MDKIKHFALCFAVTVIFGWSYGLTVGLTIEATQAEYDNATVAGFIQRFFSKDSILDLLADGLGVFVGIVLRNLITKGRIL